MPCASHFTPLEVPPVTVSCAPETFLALWRSENFLFLQENECLKPSKNHCSPSAHVYRTKADDRCDDSFIVCASCGSESYQFIVFMSCGSESYQFIVCMSCGSESYQFNVCMSCSSESYQFIVCMSCGSESYQFIVCMSCGSESYQFNVCMSCGSESHQLTVIVTQDNSSIGLGISTVHSLLHQQLSPVSCNQYSSSAWQFCTFSSLLSYCTYLPGLWGSIIYSEELFHS